MTKLKPTLSIILLVFSILMISISKYGMELYLQHIGTVFILILMLLDIKKNVMSRLGFIGLWVFAMLHSFGATWLYTNMPYNEWMINLFNWDMNESFVWERNHYDRLVHFSFGLLLLPAVKDLFIAKYKFNFKQSLLVAFLAIQMFSMFYELFEWGLAVFLSPEMADSYNGQQGDFWDAQKDMALAMVGSVFSLFYLKYRRKKSGLT